MPFNHRCALSFSATQAPLDWNPPGAEWWLLTALLTLLLLTSVLATRRWLASWRRRAISRRAGRGEARAERLLRRAGYEVLGSQVPQAWPIEFGAKRITVQLRVDYLVRRDGKLYVADAKTGAHPTSQRSAATRRQLLEYLLAYGADGALVVDMEQRRVVAIRFPGLGSDSHTVA